MKKLLFIAFAALICLSSCTDRLTDFTVISTKNFPIGTGKPTNIVKADKRVVGKDTKHIVLCIPFGTPNLKQAIDKAIEAYPGAIGLADGVVKHNYFSVFFYGKNSFVVEGTPIYEADVNKTADGNSSYGNLQNQSSSDSGLLFFHEVKSGESLTDIAKSYGVSVADIIRWNGLSSSSVPQGTKLKIHVK